MLYIIVAAVLYNFIGLFVARREWAKFVYKREQVELPTERMPDHSRNCAARSYSTSEYRRRNCSCGYYRHNEEFPALWLTWLMWPLVFVENFIKGGTYTPNKKSLSNEDYVKRMERELEISQLD